MKTETPTVGRPAAEVKIPRGRFTFEQLCSANSHLAKLTLRNFMKRDKALGKNSEIVRIEDERGEPVSDAGFGRKPFLYIRRELLGKNGGTRQVGYHVHTAKAPTHTIKRTELKNGRGPHGHHVIEVGKPSGASGASIISFAPVPNGAPIPSSVTVNFLKPKNNASEAVTVTNPSTSTEASGHDTPQFSEGTPAEASESTPPTPPATPEVKS